MSVHGHLIPPHHRPPLRSRGRRRVPGRRHRSHCRRQPRMEPRHQLHPLGQQPDLLRRRPHLYTLTHSLTLSLSPHISLYSSLEWVDLYSKTHFHFFFFQLLEGKIPNYRMLFCCHCIFGLFFKRKWSRSYSEQERWKLPTDSPIKNQEKSAGLGVINAVNLLTFCLLFRQKSSLLFMMFKTIEQRLGTRRTSTTCSE